MFFRVTTKHYSPKDSETGLHSIVSAPSEDAFWKHIKSQFSLEYNDIDEEEEQDDEGEEKPETEVKNPDANELDRAKQFNVAVEPSWGDYYRFSGKTNDIIRTLRGDTFQEPEDTYYGVTQFEWEDIDGDLDVATLKAALGDRFVDVTE